MRMERIFTALLAAVSSAVLLTACTGEGEPFNAVIDSVEFSTTEVPDGGAGQLYEAQITFTTEGETAPPDRFELTAGVLPAGVTLVEGRDSSGIQDGTCWLLGFPRHVCAGPGVPPKGGTPFFVSSVRS